MGVRFIILRTSESQQIFWGTQIVCKLVLDITHLSALLIYQQLPNQILYA
jgi:hypothetical protein